MSTLLLPDLARENAASNRRIAHSVAVAAEQLEQGFRGQVESRSLRGQAARGAQKALDHALAQAEAARAHWQGVLGAFEDGMPRDEGQEMLQVILDVFDAWFSLVQPTRDLSARAADLGAAPEGLDRLDAASRAVAALRSAAEELRGFVTAKRAPIDPAVLARARDAMAQGRFKSPDAVRARLGDRQE
jgi:hypothetical protein